MPHSAGLYSKLCVRRPAPLLRGLHMTGKTLGMCEKNNNKFESNEHM